MTQSPDHHVREPLPRTINASELSCANPNLSEQPFDPDLNTIHLYIRCSHEDSAVSGLGLEAQEIACRSIADQIIREHGPHNVRVYVDRAVSAYKKKTASFVNRPAGKSLLLAAKRGDHVVFARLDRAFRRIQELCNQMASWEDAGVSLHFHTPKFDTASAMGKMMLQIFGVFAEFESTMQSERTKAGLERARARGTFDRQAKAGQKMKTVGRAQNGTRKRKAVLDRRDLAFCRLVRWLVDTKGKSFRRATVMLNDEFRTRRMERPCRYVSKSLDDGKPNVGRRAVTAAYEAAYKYFPDRYYEKGTVPTDELRKMDAVRNRAGASGPGQ